MKLETAYICDAIRTPFGRYGGALSSVRPDDLGAVPLQALVERNPSVDWSKVDDVILGCANQAGEDNRNVARMSALLAGLAVDVSGTTINRLCGSGMDAVAMAARAIKVGDAQLMVAGGVESMSRAPFVLPKSESAFARSNEIFDTTIGWRFINERIRDQYGVESMPETAENVAEEFSVSRQDQDRFAVASQQKTAAARAAGFFAAELTPVAVPKRKRGRVIEGFDMVEVDEHPRPDSSAEKLAKLPTPFRNDGTVTAGNASGVNDGACALLLASEEASKAHGLTRRASVLSTATVGIEPRIMGMGPAPAARKVLALSGLTLEDMDVIELNEAFASQSLAVLRDLHLADDDPRVNPNGGAIAIGHPLGVSGARLITTALNQLEKIEGTYALCTMCIGVGQGIATIIERTPAVG